MIYKITFDDGRIDWCTAKDPLHLSQSYDAGYYFSLQEIESIDEISDEEAKTIMVDNTEFDGESPDDMHEQISLYDLAISEDFAIIASTDYFQDIINSKIK